MQEYGQHGMPQREILVFQVLALIEWIIKTLHTLVGNNSILVTISLRSRKYSMTSASRKAVGILSAFLST
jgi:hypothetical protein